MLHAGLDFSRKRLDVCLIGDDGQVAGRLAVPPDRDGLHGLVRRIAPLGEPVQAVIESMTGARFVHDTLEGLGWDVMIADAPRVTGLAPLACKTDKIDSQVLAVLSHRDLVPEIWLPDPRVRREREQARFRLHLVKHKSSLKSRIHSTMITFGHPCPVSDLFGAAGRQRLDRLSTNARTETWRGTVTSPASHRVTTIGEWRVAASRGRLAPSDGLSEYCAPVSGGGAVPAMKARFSAPTARASGRSRPGTITGTYSYGSTSGRYIDCRSIVTATHTATAAILSAESSTRTS